MVLVEWSFFDWGPETTYRENLTDSLVISLFTFSTKKWWNEIMRFLENFQGLMKEIYLMIISYYETLVRSYSIKLNINNIHSGSILKKLSLRLGLSYLVKSYVCQPIHRELEQMEGKVKSSISGVGPRFQPHSSTLDEKFLKHNHIFKKI